MALQLEGRIAAGNDLLDSDLRDIHIVSGAGGTFLYAATGQNGGISVYRVDGAGLASLSDTSYFSTSGITMGSFDVVSVDGADRLILSGTGNGQLVSYGFESDGDLTALSQGDLPGNGVETAGALAGRALEGGLSALYMVDGDSGALSAYVSDGAGAITGIAGLAGQAAMFEFGDVAGLETVRAGGKSWLLAADATDGMVRSYRINDATGALTYVDSLGAADGLGVAIPSAMQIIKAYGATWVLLAASGSGSLSVMKLGANGQLAPGDHILDTLATRFGGVTALEVIRVQDHVLVLAGGADDGLALFTLLPGGQLVHMQSLAHTFGAGLENVTGIEAVEVAGEIRIFVTSGAASGISQFSLSLDDLGAVIQAPATSGGSGGGSGGAQVLGTGADDLIIGTQAQDRLMGQGGDDILVASQGGAVLSGGAGADIFVLCPTSGLLKVSDFKPGVDRLDMSHFPGLRSLAQLDFTATASGIEIGYGATLIRVRSFDGETLTPSDLWPTGFDTPDRVPIPPGPVIRVITGSDGADILNGGAGKDIIHGLAGDDRIGGGASNDRVFGGTGDDVIRGNKGSDNLRGGAGQDTIFGGAGKDTVYGKAGRDMLYGEAGKDKIYGGTGNDTAYGGAGDDLLQGGKGNDLLRGGADNDVLKGGRGADRLYGGTGNDTVKGGKGDDALHGGSGRDILKGAIGRDTLSGGDGHDWLKGGGGRDKLSGEAGNDTAKGGGGRDIIGGGTGRDILKGGRDHDILKGGRGADTLFGGKGQDVLRGGAGADTLTGGGGADVFVFADNDGGGHGKDRIVDFTTGADRIRIDIAGVGFNDLTLTRQRADTGFDTVIDTGAGTITLSDMRPKDLSASDFLFS